MRTASAFTLSIAKGTPLLLGRGAARAADALRLQFRPDLVVEILLVARPGLDRLPVPEAERVEAVVAVLAPGHRAAAVVLVARPAELLGGVVPEALPEVELAPFLEVPRPVWKSTSSSSATRDLIFRTVPDPPGVWPATQRSKDSRVSPVYLIWNQRPELMDRSSSQVLPFGSSQSQVMTFVESCRTLELPSTARHTGSFLEE